MSDSDIEHIRAHDDLNKAFDSGSVFSASTEDLTRFLRALGTINIQSDQVRTKAVVRALTINHVQMARAVTKFEATIAALNQQNDKVANRIVWLTVVCAGGAVLQCAIALAALLR